MAFFVGICLAFLVKTTSSTLPTNSETIPVSIAYNIFKSCTIMFNNVKYPLPGYFSMQQDFHNQCATNGNCISLYFCDKSCKQMQSSLYQGQKFAAENVSKFLLESHSKQKYRLSCNVRFPHWRNVLGRIMFSYNDNAYWLQTGSKTGVQSLKKIQLRQAAAAWCTFALVHLLENTHVLLEVHVTSKLSVSLIFFGTAEIGIYSIRNGPLYAIADKTNNMPVRYVSNLYPLVASDLHQILKYTKQIGKPEKASKGDLKHAPVHKYSYGLDDAAVIILQNDFNCTWDYDVCDSYLFDVDRSTGFFEPELFLYLPYGQLVNEDGLVYFVLPGNRQQNRISGNILHFLYPLQANVWITLLILFVLLFLPLKIANVKEPTSNIMFWLFAVPLEQKDEYRKLQNGLCGSVILTWILVWVFMRNFYTSTVYSDITMEKDMTILPTRISDLWQINGTLSSYKLLDSLKPYFETIVFKSDATSNLPGFLFWYRKKFLNAGTHDNIARMVLGQEFVMGERDWGCDIFEQRHTGCKEQKEISGTKADDLIYLVYTKYDEDLTIFRHLPAFCNGRPVYMNNEKPLLQTMSLHKTIYYTFHSLHASDIIGRLYHSGIANYLEEVVYKAFAHVSSIKEQLKRLKAYNKFSIVTYARQFAEKDFKRIKSMSWENIRHWRISSRIEETKAVSLLALTSVWKLTFIILGVSVLVFLVEVK